MHRLQDENNKTSGRIRAKQLSGELSESQMELLGTEGILTDDIVEVLYFKAPEKNTFHSKEKREITKLEIQTSPLPKGRDYDWMYGFKKQLVEQGIGMCPIERNFYLAGKYYYEPDKEFCSTDTIFYTCLGFKFGFKVVITQNEIWIIHICN